MRVMCVGVVWMLTALSAPAWAALAEARSLAFLPGVRFAWSQAFHLEQRPDGTATLVSGTRRQTGTWTDDGRTLTVIYASPLFESSAYGEYQGVLYRQDYFETGRVFRRIQGSLELGRAETVPLSYFVWAEGPLTGQVETFSDASSPALPVEARKPGLRLPLDAAEFDTGAQWAGVMTAPAPDNDPFNTNQDVLRIISERRASGVRDIERMSWRVRGNALVLTRPWGNSAVQLRYWRMGVHPDNGTERWMFTVLDGSGVTQAFECLVARVDATAVFTAAGIVGEWFNSASVAGGDELRLRFFADRSADYRGIAPDGSVFTVVPINGWDIQRSGTRMHLLRPSTPFLSYGRWWQPVRRHGDWMIAMETLDYRQVSTGEQRTFASRLGAYRYIGPAVR